MDHQAQPSRGVNKKERLFVGTNKDKTNATDETLEAKTELQQRNRLEMTSRKILRSLNQFYSRETPPLILMFFQKYKYKEPSLYRHSIQGQIRYNDNLTFKKPSLNW